MAQTISYIYSTERRGAGTDKNPIRMCPQLWTNDGRLVADYDPFTNKSFFLPIDTRKGPYNFDGNGDRVISDRFKMNDGLVVYDEEKSDPNIRPMRSMFGKND